MEHKCNICNRNFKSAESLDQHNSSKHKSSGETKKRSSKSRIMLGLGVLIIIFLSLTIYLYAQKPGNYNDFATCLSDKGAIVYGNDYCSFTVQQLGFFGKSKEHLNYIKCIDSGGLCEEKGVQITPTWEIDGNTYSGVQDFEKLSVITGCEIK